jgi:hypothetical protein
MKFKGVSAEDLFGIYTDSERHGAAVGSTASTSDEVGREFWVFGKNGVKGKNLHIVPKRMVVQTWRSRRFGKDAPDSILTLVFSDTNDGAQIDLFQVNVPDHLYDNTHDGWKRRYWPSWREYVKENYGPATRSSRRRRSPSRSAFGL